ncbi:hypothetical protein A2673_03080 [Candidatus Kaiserbacteria bacterium RIFCSPHIGHO2_01_FULL_50_13]|nr:MAG: hypothetical protein A2673_03080 [Candidatus Kaiserbacteria bacterium RIFCSPHIGHO2_01_FULL_50_13]
MLLLAAYAVGALLLHSRRDRLFKDQMLQNAALALPLLVLAAFWYFVPECREGWWTLAGSVVIALVAIFGTSLWKKTPGDKKQNPWTAFHP